MVSRRATLDSIRTGTSDAGGVHVCEMLGRCDNYIIIYSIQMVTNDRSNPVMLELTTRESLESIDQ